MTDYVVNIIIVDLIMFNKESHIYIYIYMPSIAKIFQLIKIIYISWLRIDRCSKLSAAFIYYLWTGFHCAHSFCKINTTVSRFLDIPSTSHIAKFEMARNLNNTRNQLYFIITQLIAFIITLHCILVINHARNLSGILIFTTQ